MSQASTGLEAPTSPNPAGLELMPDSLSEAMVATAAGYFLTGSTVDGQQRLDFRLTFQRLYGAQPYLGRTLLPAGLLAAGFTIETEPILVDTPPIPTEEAERALDKEVFLRSWYNVAETIIEMGINVASPDKPDNSGYDEAITERACQIGWKACESLRI